MALIFLLSDEACAFGENCCYGHVCPSTTKCHFNAQGRCKFRGGEDISVLRVTWGWLTLEWSSWYAQGRFETLNTRMSFPICIGGTKAIHVLLNMPHFRLRSIARSVNRQIAGFDGVGSHCIPLPPADPVAVCRLDSDRTFSIMTADITAPTLSLLVDTIPRFVYFAPTQLAIHPDTQSPRI